MKTPRHPDKAGPSRRTFEQNHAPVLKTLCNSGPSAAIMAKIVEAGYCVLEVTPESNGDPQFMKLLDGVIYSQQYYSDFHRAPLDDELAALDMKIAVIFHPGMLEECLKDDQFKFNWGLNRNYGPTYTLS